MRERGMQPSKRVEPGQVETTAEPMYEPPQVEAVVNTTDLEREALYAGAGAYGPS